MIERLLTHGSVPEVAICHCVLGEDTLRLFPNGAKQSTCCDGPCLTKDLQTEPKKVNEWTITVDWVVI